jgi:hypothetical protein
MKILHISCLLTAAALIGVSAPASAAEPAHQREAAVNVVVENLSPDVARAIKRRAALGRSVLIQYLERGRFTYEVRTEQADKEAKASEPVTIAKSR